MKTINDTQIELGNPNVDIICHSAAAKGEYTSNVPMFNLLCDLFNTKSIHLYNFRITIYFNYSKYFDKHTLAVYDRYSSRISYYDIMSLERSRGDEDT